MADNAQAQDLKTYRGNCHCKAYVFEAKVPEIKKLSDCNCSSCYKKGALWEMVQPGNLTWVKGDPETLSDYQFGSKMFHHRFCPTCGTNLYFSGTMPGQGLMTGVNVRSFQDVDVWGFPITTFDGAQFPPKYEPPKYTGPEPKAEIEGAKVYTGSCHCGAITLALKCKPLDKTFGGESKPEDKPLLDRLTEDNCSICRRNGYVWTYPKKDQLVIEGRENFTFYTFGFGIMAKSFCKICGVPIHNEPQTFTEEELAALPEQVRKFAAGKDDLRPLNIRVLNDVDLKDLPIMHGDGWNQIKPLYANP